MKKKPHKKSHFLSLWILMLCLSFSSEGQNTSLIKDSLLSAQIRDLAYGKTLAGDYDADGDIDIFITGSGKDSLESLIYRNDGPSGYTELDMGFPNLLFPDASWNDFDNDGDLDIFLSGAINPGDSLIPQAHLYAYDSGHYLDTQIDIDGVYTGSSAWADFDNDGDQDLFISGAQATTSNGWYVYTSSKLYVNEGSGIFSEANPGIKGVYNCQVDVSDYDNDMYPDILLCGELYDDGGYWHRSTMLYKNNGNNTFSQVETGLPPLRGGDVSFGDYDNDGHTDILLSGDPSTPTNLVYIYRNSGDGSFYDIGIEIIGTAEMRGIKESNTQGYSVYPLRP
jgi:hypothetical protein